MDTLREKRVLDICCGRGGGLAFLAKYYEPKEALGVDFSAHQVATAQEKYGEGKSSISKLNFIQGDAERPLEVEG
jgi:ubiquinone/menaquinone biosynthesis C-methylase UbiE